MLFLATIYSLRTPFFSAWRIALPAALAVALAGCAANDDKLAVYRGLKAVEQGNFARAVEQLGRAVKLPLEPAHAAMLQNHLGIALARENQPADAIQAFETAHRLAPDMPEPAYNLGVLNLDAGRADLAEDWFQKAADSTESDIKALEFLSAIHRTRSDWDQARGWLMEARRRQPHAARINAALGLVEMQAGNLDQAATLLQQCLEREPLYPPAIFNLAMVRRRQGNLIQARSLFHEYTRLTGINQEHADQARQAVETLNHTLAAQAPADAPPPPAKLAPPPTPAALMATARLLERRGRAEAAVNNYLLAARAADRVNQPVLRQQAVDAAVKACAEDARAQLNMGMYFQEHQRQPEALWHFKQAAALDPQWFDAHMALARVAMEQSEFDAALVSLKTAVQLRTDDPDALWTLAQVYDRSLKLVGPARRHYTLFLERFPADVRARAARRRLADMQTQQTS